MTVIYSFPPGTGGDHVCGMLAQQHSLDGIKVTSLSTVKNLEHLVKIGKANIKDYFECLQYHIDNNHQVIASHHTSFPILNSVTCVRAVWSDVDLNSVFISRDLFTNNWEHDVKPYINGDIQNILQDKDIAIRKRLLLYMQHIKLHGPWQINESPPDQWITFSIDKIFTKDFVDDVVMLADKLGLKVNQSVVEQQHNHWLTLNPRKNFTIRKTVRHLERSIAL